MDEIRACFVLRFSEISFSRSYSLIKNGRKPMSSLVCGTFCGLFLLFCFSVSRSGPSNIKSKNRACCVLLPYKVIG
ncbi:hypothetical protein D3C87_1195060 [compost metagenome]